MYLRAVAKSRHAGRAMTQKRCAPHHLNVVIVFAAVGAPRGFPVLWAAWVLAQSESQASGLIVAQDIAVPSIVASVPQASTPCRFMRGGHKAFALYGRIGCREARDVRQSSVEIDELGICLQSWHETQLCTRRSHRGRSPHLAVCSDTSRGQPPWHTNDERHARAKLRRRYRVILVCLANLARPSEI